MAFDFSTNNPIFYVLIIWVAIFALAKASKLDKHGFEITPYSLTYKNRNVQFALTKLLNRTQRATRIFANVSIVAGFIMMGYAFWFLISNLFNYFVQPESFSEVTVLIPGITLQSTSALIPFLLSIPIVLVIHEGAHGIVATLEKIRIKTGGFAVFIALFAGFVEPDEEEFAKARKLSKLRVIGAGATSNVLFSFIIAALLIFNPAFALLMPEPIRDVFYDEPFGVPILSVAEGSGAAAAGLLKNDIITAVNGIPVLQPKDFPSLAPGHTAVVTIIRDGETLQLNVVTQASSDDPEKGLLGITRAAFPSYKPAIPYYIQWSPDVFMFLFWLWMLSLFIGIFNMLPLPILDGGKFIHSIIEKRISEKTLKVTMWSIYGFTLVIFGLNIALSVAKSGFRPI